MATQQKLPPPPADVVAAANDLGAKWGINPTALLSVWGVESGYKTHAVGGAGGAYVGVFQLNSQFVPNFTERALGTQYTPDQYKQLSIADQAKVQDYYWQQAGIRPGFFSGDINIDTAKAWALQLAPSNAKNIDYTNPNAVISNTVQADVISQSRGTVTVGSTTGSLTLLSDIPIQPTNIFLPLNSVQTLNLLDGLSADNQQKLLDAYNQTNSQLGVPPVEAINSQSFLTHTQNVINTAYKDGRVDVLTAMGIDGNKVIEYSNFRESKGTLVEPQTVGTLTASNIVSQVDINAGGKTFEVLNKTGPMDVTTTVPLNVITKITAGDFLTVVRQVDGGFVEYRVSAGADSESPVTEIIISLPGGGGVALPGTVKDVIDELTSPDGAGSTYLTKELVAAAASEIGTQGQFVISKMTNQLNGTPDTTVNSPTTASNIDPTLLTAYNNAKISEQPDRPNSDYRPDGYTSDGVYRVNISGVNSPSAPDRPTPAQKKLPAITAYIPNPVHGLASYTYTWVLWWVGIKDYNALMAGADVGVGVAYNLSYDSYVLAEDAGLYPDRRHPSTLGLNYNIQDVEIDSVVALNKNTKSSSDIKGTFTIIEPYGVTFIDSLVSASIDPATGLPQNYISQPYMLELNFVGYDDQGNPIPGDQIGLTRKRFPIRFLSMKLNVTGKGAEYKIEFCPTGHAPHHTKENSIPKDFTIVATTVNEFFNGPKGLAAQMNKFSLTEVAARKRDVADAVKFDIDRAIGESKIVDPQQTGLAKSNPDSKGKTIDVQANTFTIPHSMNIIDIIQKIMPSSQFFIDQLGLAKPNTAASQTQIYSHYKVTTQVIYGGIQASGAVTEGAFDNSNNRRCMIMSYGIHQYWIGDGTHPLLPQMTNSQPFVIKDYQYLYTGKNIDIIDFKLNFDMTYYTAVMSYTNKLPSYKTTQSTAINKLLDRLPSPVLGIGSLSNLIKELATVPQINPQVFKPVVNKENLTKGGNQKDRSAVAKAADVGESLLSNPASGDMLNVDLTIIGDPTLLKQDDFLYVPSPTGSPNWNAQTSQADFVRKYGHVRMENGTMVVRLTVNTPLDIDTDYNNTGLSFPPVSTRPAIFSGLYKIISIKSTFSKGKFTQVLKLVRHFNSDAVTTFNQVTENQREDNTQINGSNSVGVSQSNQTQAAGDTNGAFNPNINDGGVAYRPGEREYAERAAAEGNRNAVITTTTYDQNGQVRNVVNTVPR